MSHAGWGGDVRVVVTGGSGFIGGHLQLGLRRRGAEVLSLDLSPPPDPTLLPNWLDVNVLDLERLTKAVRGFTPTHVVHLAAEVRTDASMTVADYAINTVGTENLLQVVEGTHGIERVIIVSSQFVCRPGHVPVDEFDVSPETAYGESKVIVENLTRTRGTGDATWTIVRPTTIWGPRDDRYRSAFYALLRRGWYVHPDTGPCLRSYGFVGNAAWQIEELLRAPAEDVASRVFYVGDRPFDIRDYAEEFARQLGRPPVRTVPMGLARMAAKVGDRVSRLGVPFPINSSRLRFMTTDYPVPIEETFKVLGEPPYSLADGVRQTIDWLRAERWAAS